MNYIQKLQDDIKAKDLQLQLLNLELTALMAYLSSSKFHGTDSDYVHVSTDILPKLREIRELAY